MPKFDVLAMGSLTLDTFVEPHEMLIQHEQEEDLMCFEVGQKIAMRTVAKHVGGAAANTGVGFANLGLRTVAVGTIGDDAAGEFIVHRLQKMGVGTEFITQRRATPSSASVIFMTPDGRRTVFHERAAHSMPRAPRKMLDQTRALYCGHLAHEEEKLFASIPGWKKSGAHFFAWNPGKTQLQQGLHAFKKLLPHVDVLVVNVEELELLTRLEAHSVELEDAFDASRTGGVTVVRDVRPLIQKVLVTGVRQVVVTDGRKGAQGFTADQHVFCPTASRRHAISSLGAGDSFAVGVVAAALHGRDLTEQLWWGSCNADSVVRIFGAQEGLLSLGEMQRSVKKFL